MNKKETICNLINFVSNYDPYDMEISSIEYAEILSWLLDELSDRENGLKKYMGDMVQNAVGEAE